MPTVQSNGINLYYETHGEGQPLLFIHGLGSSSRDWEFQVPAFSISYQVITFDLRGHGQSDKPTGPYSMAMFAADTASLLRALAIDQAHVVGLSLGGGIAFQLAVEAPQIVQTLIISADQDYTPLSLKEAYTAKIPNAQLVTIPDSHHALPVEKPREFNQALEEFLAKHP